MGKGWVKNRCIWVGGGHNKDMRIDIEDTTAFIDLDEETFKQFLKVGRIIITDTENHVCKVFYLD